MRVGGNQLMKLVMNPPLPPDIELEVNVVVHRSHPVGLLPDERLGKRDATQFNAQKVCNLIMDVPLLSAAEDVGVFDLCGEAREAMVFLQCNGGGREKGAEQRPNSKFQGPWQWRSLFAGNT
ncbi:hypothetical protein Dimus_019361 [Dionaea muscipula]